MNIDFMSKFLAVVFCFIILSCMTLALISFESWFSKYLRGKSINRALKKGYSLEISVHLSNRTLRMLHENAKSEDCSIDDAISNLVNGCYVYKGQLDLIVKHLKNSKLKDGVCDDE